MIVAWVRPFTKTVGAATCFQGSNSTRCSVDGLVRIHVDFAA